MPGLALVYVTNLWDPKRGFTWNITTRMQNATLIEQICSVEFLSCEAQKINYQS